MSSSCFKGAQMLESTARCHRKLDDAVLDDAVAFQDTIT